MTHPSPDRVSTPTDPDPSRPRSRPGPAPWLALLALGLGIGLSLGFLAGRDHAPLLAAPADVDQAVPSDAALAAQVHFPALASLDEEVGCDWRFSVQNLSVEPIKVVMVGWSDEGPTGCTPDCQSRVSVRLSESIPAGQSWHFDPPAGERDLRGATLFSFGDQTLDAAGIAPGDERRVADLVAERMRQAFEQDCRSYSAFKSAFDRGETFADLPMELSHGGAIAAQLGRDCDIQLEAATLRARASVPGIGGAQLGARDPDAHDFGYTVPIVFADRSGHESILQIQNAGASCASIEIGFKAQDDCLRMVDCQIPNLGPGQSLSVAASSCMEPGWQGSAWLRSNQPLALVVDDRILRAGDQWALSSAAGLPLLRGEQTSGREPTATVAGSATLYGPLYYSEYQGWDTVVQVVNLSPDRSAKVKVYFLDRSGDVVTTLVDWICPRGSQSFMLPVTGELAGKWVGSVRVENESWFTPGGEAMPGLLDTLAGTIHALRYEGRERERLSEAASYAMLDHRSAFAWPAGGPTGGLDGGVGLIAIPRIGGLDEVRDAASWQLSVSNLVHRHRGFTDYTLILQDANGRLDEHCLRLHSGQVVDMDLSHISPLSSDFTGSALVSAVHWEHPVWDEDGRWQHDALGLAATVSRRARDASAGDALELSTGHALRGSLASHLARDLGPTLCPPAPMVERVAGDRLALGDSTLAVYLPAIDIGDAGTACDANLAIQALGDRPTRLLLLAFGEASSCGDDCAAPLGLVCSPLLAPGGSWDADASLLPAGSRSAVVYALDGAVRAIDLGLDRDPSVTAADVLCQAAREALAGEGCAAWQRLARAMDSGASFEGIPIDRMQGAAISAEVQRDCAFPGGARQALSYAAPDRLRLGAAGPRTGAYHYALPMLDGGVSTLRRIHVQNAGQACQTVTLRVAGIEDCAAAEICTTVSLAPGEARALDSAACLADGRVGHGWLESDGPLAVVVDGGSDPWLDSYVGRPTWLAPTDDGAPRAEASRVAVAPLTFSEYQGWTTRVSVQNLDLERPAKVMLTWLDRSGDLIDIQIDWICPAGSASFLLPAIEDLPGTWVGSLRAESLDYRDAKLEPVEAPAIHAVAELQRRFEPQGDPAGRQVLRYELVDASAALRPPAAAATDPDARGAGMLALTSLRRPADGALGSSSSAVAIANLAEPAGFTDFSVFLYDANGPLDLVCQRLYSRQVEYIDLASWSYMSPGFQGGMLISATHWEHPVYDAGRIQSDHLGLAAVHVRHRGPLMEGSRSVEPVSAAPARALSAALAARMAPGLDAAACRPKPREAPGPLHLPILLGGATLGGR